jgi:hypothetical protein
MVYHKLNSIQTTVKKLGSCRLQLVNLSAAKGIVSRFVPVGPVYGMKTKANLFYLTLPVIAYNSINPSHFL